jgi:hypothetical protein
MEQTPFELTPKQQGILATLSRETGKPIPALLDEALEVLQEREHMSQEAAAPPATSKHIWEIAEELFGDVPEEDLAPVDGAARHDYYIRYGWPKRSQ